MPTVCSHLLVPGRKQALGAAPFFFLGSFLPWHCPCARRSPEPSFHSLPSSSGRSWIRNMTMSNEPKLDSSLKSGFSTKAAKVALLGLTQPVERELPECASNAVEIGPLEWKGDVLAVGILEGSISKDGNGPFGILDPSLLGLLREVAEEEDFTGKTGQSTFIRLTGFGFKRLGLIGLGKPESIKSTKVWKGLGEAVAAAAKTAQAASVAIVCTAAADLSDNEKLDIASAVTAGVILGSYEDARFKSESKKMNIKSIDILGLGPKHFFEDKLKKTLKVVDGVIACRKLVNSPANVLTPSALAEEAEEIASSYSNVITAKILEEEACRELKMGSYLGVAAASANPPKFIHLQYRPSGDVKVKLAIVGKGLTFDSGGYNLKTGQGSSIELMKFDMGGAAAALGAAKAIGAISPPGVEVNFIVAACENMISGTGMRPGDILTASNGKTIEVNNTDAEGRLTLADALVYACKLKVDKIVDLATLTGACVVALGNEVGGMFTPNDELAEELSECSTKVGEKLWRLPLEDAYWEMMKSGIADMVNTGGRPGGSITAALFLRQFVDEKIPWAHLDIAGPVWSEKKRGATGFAVATLVEWVLKHSAS